MWLVLLFGVLTYLLIHTYVLYPVYLKILIFFLKDNREQKKDYFDTSDRRPLRTVLLIAAYNEEKVIEEKLMNSISLDISSRMLADMTRSPQNNIFKVIVVSDGSTDKTNSIVEKFAEQYSFVELLPFERSGKSGAINKALCRIDADIIIFSDANTMYKPDAIDRILEKFSNERVGCVCGRLIYRNPGNVLSGTGESFYWKYETKLKILESSLGYIAGANGAIYAIRKELFEQMPVGTINDDFLISMRIVQKGFMSTYVEDAIAFEDVAPTIKGEFRRHIRDGAGHFLAIMHLCKLLNVFKGRASFIFWSHRILRWFAPHVLIILLFLNLYIVFEKRNLFAMFTNLEQQVSQFFFISTLIFQLLFYLFACLGFLYRNKKSVPFIVYIPFYFCNLNLALLIGFFKAIFSMQKATWKSTER